jgi:Rrf2 family protein
VLLSRAAEIALAALPHLDGRGPLAPGRGVKELAEKANVPAPFLAKVLQRLVERGVLRSKRGRTGGFVLGRPSSEITVADVVLALEGHEELEAAFPPLQGPAGRLFAAVRSRVFNVMKTTTVADLGKDAP